MIPEPGDPMGGDSCAYLLVWWPNRLLTYVSWSYFYIMVTRKLETYVTARSGVRSVGRHPPDRPTEVLGP